MSALTKKNKYQGGIAVDEPGLHGQTMSFTLALFYPCDNDGFSVAVVFRSKAQCEDSSHCRQDASCPGR